MAKNSNMHAAKKNQNDEFYTQLADIESEVMRYKDQFKGKVVFCNCDDPAQSNFWKFFELNFDNYDISAIGFVTKSTAEILEYDYEQSGLMDFIKLYLEMMNVADIMPNNIVSVLCRFLYQ